MTKFGTKLQDYATGKSKGCNHPINKVDDNRFCHECGTQLPERKISDVASRISALEAQNARLVEALEKVTYALECWKFDESWDKGDIEAVAESRALLAEVTQ